jgi:hypothetical protein
MTPTAALAQFHKSGQFRNAIIERLTAAINEGAINGLIEQAIQRVTSQ